MVRFNQLMYGFYPVELRWRVDLAFVLLSRGAGAGAVRQAAATGGYGLVFTLVYPLIAYLPAVGRGSGWSRWNRPSSAASC